MIMKLRPLDLADDKLAVGGFAEDDDFAVEVVNREPLVLIIKSFWLDLPDDGSAVGDFAEYDVLAVEVVELRPW